MQEAALACDRGADAGGVRARVVERSEVPSAVLRQGGDSVRAEGQQVPQLLRRGDTTGEPAAHADDRDRIVDIGLRDLRRGRASAHLRRPQPGVQVAGQGG